MLDRMFRSPIRRRAAVRHPAAGPAPRCLALALLLGAGLAAAGPAPAGAQIGRFGAPGAPNVGPPEEALWPEAAALQDRLEEEGWMIRGQSTFIFNGVPGYRARYSGGRSLSRRAQGRETFSFDLIFGRKLWEGAELIANPAVTQGYGLSNAQGIAAFPNGEAFRLGTRDPVIWLPRGIFRQTIALSEDTVPYDNDPLRFNDPLPRERITITIGRFSVWDIFDDNRYAHDPRTQFMNWAMVGGGAFDYVADARGFTNSFAVEWENGVWALRAGAFQVAREVNSLDLDPQMLRAWQILGSIERFWEINGRGGAVRLIYGASRTRQSPWSQISPRIPESFEKNPFRVALKHNLTVSYDQELTGDFGIFARWSWNDGRTQNWMFTEMDQAFSFGGVLTGERWGRPQDTLGLATNIGWISPGRRRFLQAGGLGFITGDGGLNYAPEWATELYYNWNPLAGVNMALGYQFVVNPAYNTARGPVNVFALRLRTAF
jgi:high affinity Mn2+ porin